MQTGQCFKTTAAMRRRRVDKSMAPIVRARLLISSTKVSTTFTTSGAGRELRAPPNWLT